MIIRKTCEDDINRIMEIYQDPTSYEPYIAKVYLEKEPELGIVAEINKKIVGYVHINPHFDTVWIGGLHVHSEYRGRRIGKRILKEALWLTESLNEKIALIDVQKDNVQAIKMYKSLGFENVYVRSHLVGKVRIISNILDSENLSSHEKDNLNRIWDSITNSNAYKARCGIIMGCHVGWKLRREDFKNFEVLPYGKESILIFREVVDLELAPNIYGLFEKKYSDSKFAKTSCPRFEINLTSSNYTNSKKLLQHVVYRARQEGADLIDIWTWKDDPLFELYNGLRFENWGDLYLMQREL